MPVPLREFRAIKTVTFDGGAGSGAIGSVALFTVTGDVAVRYVIGKCTTDLVSAGGGSIEVGVSGNTDLFGPGITATTLDTNMFHDPGSGTPSRIATLNTADDSAAFLFPHGKSINQNIIATVTAGDITAGVVSYYCVWAPLSAGASVA